MVALGVDEGGIKHILGLWQGATENTTVVKELLEDLVDRGLDTKRRYPLVLDGAKALRAGVDRVFRQARRSATLSDPQAPKRKGSPAGELPGGL